MTVVCYNRYTMTQGTFVENLGLIGFTYTSRGWEIRIGKVTLLINASPLWVGPGKTFPDYNSFYQKIQEDLRELEARGKFPGVTKA
jgi:hypothetical protein